jgi:ribosomal-protein-alanine N-acetyltransferase
MNLAPAQIRPMTPADIDQVLAIAASLPTAPHWPASAYLDAQASTPPRVALVAEIDNSIAGFAIASHLPPQAELELIAVAPAHQRQGLAQQLFAALIANLRALNVSEILLELRASNHPALALYRRLNFVVNGRRSRYYQNPVEDSILMRLGI